MLKRGYIWFAAFTTIFVVCAAYVFWGTWSPSVNQLAPDDQSIFLPGYFAPLGELLKWRCLANCEFIPDDLLLFLGTPYWRHEFKYVFAVYMAALAVVYYCRGRGLGRLASYGAALLLSFSGYWLTLFSAGHAGWFRWMTYGVFAFGLCDRAVRVGKMRHWVMLAAVLAWASRWQVDLWLLFTAFAAFYFVWCCWRERKMPSWKGLVIAAVLFFAIGGPNFRDAIVNALGSREQQIAEGQTVSQKDAEDGDKRWIFVTNWSLPPNESAEFFIPRLNGDTSCPMTLALGARQKSVVKPYTGALGRPKDAPSGNYRQHSLYVGLVTCLFALFGVISWRRGGRKDVLFFAGAALLCWLFSMGRYFEVLYRLVYALPFGDTLRAPVKWHHLTELALAFLAAYGIEAALETLQKFKLSTKISAIIVGAVVLIGVADLARVDSLYCAPVDVSKVRASGLDMQFTFLRRQDFANPQIAALQKAGRVVSYAMYPGTADVYLVGILNPFREPIPLKMPPMSALVLGVISLFATIVVSVYSLRKCR